MFAVPRRRSRAKKFLKCLVATFAALASFVLIHWKLSPIPESSLSDHLRFYVDAQRKEKALERERNYRDV